MPFPSGRCRTCRARHLKCDEQRPVCTRCRTSNRLCTWDDSDGSNVLFRDENAYASSQKKRQRGGARWSTPPKSRSPSSVAASVSALERSAYPCTVLTSRRNSSQSSMSPSELRAPLSRSPSESIKDHALARLLRRYMCADSCMAVDIWGFLHDYQHDFFPLKDNTTLSYAIHAVALSNYGRVSGYPEAVTMSQEHYSRALSMTGNAVRNELSRIDDELVLTVMLLSAYEDFSGSFDKITLTTRGFHHLSGVMALLKLRRQQQDSATKRSHILNSIVRRRIIRTSVYRGVEVPDYLQCSSDAEETALDLSLNACLIEVASLRSHALALLNNLQASYFTLYNNPRQVTQFLIRECTAVDARLEAWYTYLPPGWKTQIRQMSDRDFASAAHLGIFYTNRVLDGNTAGFDSQVCLSRYRAARLVTNSILAKVLAYANSVALPASTFNFDHLVVPSIPEVDSTIAQLTDDVCASVPYFFDCHPSSGTVIPATQEDLIDRTPAPKVLQLVWSLIIASAQMKIPEHQRVWIRQNLALVAKVAGSGTLEDLAEVDLHLHRGLIRNVESVH